MNGSKHLSIAGGTGSQPVVAPNSLSNHGSKIKNDPTLLFNQNLSTKYLSDLVGFLTFDAPVMQWSRTLTFWNEK